MKYKPVYEAWVVTCAFIWDHTYKRKSYYTNTEYYEIFCLFPSDLHPLFHEFSHHFLYSL